MVGVGVAEGAGQGDTTYYGEYYPDQYYVPPEMCAHPQHPHHPHICTLHAEYGNVGMPVVTSGTMLPQMIPQVMDENQMRHYLVHPPHPPHHHPPHHPPPQHHHQPPHHYGPANGAAAPQQYYGPGYPAHYHPLPPHMQPSPPPPPPVYQKDERTQRQYSKLKQKLERKQTNRNNGIELNSGATTPSLSPRKELNGSRSGGASSGVWSEGEGSSAGASVHGDDEHDTQTVLDLLSATRTPQVSEMTPTSALVQWNSPLPEGVTMPSVELTYDLLLGDRGRYKAIYSGPSLSCRVRDLRPGCEYSVCLQIRAGELTGAATEAATFRAPAAPPAAPVAPRVTQRGRTNLLLRWPAATDNGARIEHYVLQLDRGTGYADLAHPRARQHTANDLVPRTRYRFRLAAVNSCGRGDWSEDLVVWTAGAPPSAPAPPLLASFSPASLALRWDRRAPEEDFTLQMDDAMRGHGFLPVYSGHDAEYECKSLRRASDYRFRLRCETDDGPGPWSTEVTYSTPPEAPGPPGRPLVRGKIHSRAFRLHWDAPTDNGGAKIDSYRLELDEGSGYKEAYSGPEREAHCDRLRPGTSYRARVRCSNVAGASSWAIGESVTTEAAVPSACSAPECAGKPRATAAPVRWAPPDFNGGAPIDEYQLEVVDSRGDTRLAYSGPVAECIVRELSPGQEYLLQVRAVNRVGSGPLSPALTVTTAPAPPAAPPMPRVNVETPRSARLDWDVPEDNGSPIIDYRLEMSSTIVDEAFTEVFKGLETNFIVKNLIPFSPYFFRVCATNSAGRGSCSAVRDVLMPRAPPAAPSELRHESTADSLRLAWTAPVDHGAEITKYKIAVDDVEIESAGAATFHTIENLTPESTYRVRVAAVNELGDGDWCEWTKLITRPLPPQPPVLECIQRAHNYLKFKWGEGAAPESTQYCLEMKAPDGREFRPAYRGSARNCKIKKLKEDTVYAFRIRASDARGGRGEFSVPIEERTSSAPPPAPKAPLATALSPRSATVEWEGAAERWTLQSSRGTEGEWRQMYTGTVSQCMLEELEPGGEYQLRVCGMRAGLAGAWSPITKLVLPTPAPTRARIRSRPARRLSARHEAILLVGGFLLVAVVMAVLVQRLVDRRDHGTF